MSALTVSQEAVARLRREEFLVTQDKTWFNTATYGPLPASNLRAQLALLEEMMHGGGAKGVGHWWEGAAGVRGKVGALIGCDPADVALLHSTGEGISLVSLGLDWQSGDEVVLYDQEFPSGVYPWLALEERGVVARFVHDAGRYRFDVDDVEAVMSDHTRVVCMSLVNCYHGFRAPIEEISKLCKARGVWLVVDAVQAAGALRVDVASLGADLVAAHGYKSLCSGYGIGFCYVSPALREVLHVSAPGWKSIEDAPFLDKQLQYNLRYPPGARRYESSVPNLAGMYGLGASIDLFLNAGVELINDWVLQVSAEVIEALEETGYPVVSSTREGERSGIVSARVPDGDAARVAAALAEQQVACAVRDGRVRVSCHLFNDRSDIERLVAALPAP
ncbi:MAG TPA: aminotransferase class V-fold PLP-dependent enzyme [Acidimicrobiales bacterium]|nr:aminotransferase class V-fold PLP-dependent enzyme [Acidimicrobiales bacterium]